ncbi:hypothetical protein JXL19_10755 [bacterium]|nr:hypothetical protein [bacterium]
MKRKKIWKVLLICVFTVIFAGVFCIETTAQLSAWPEAITDPYSVIFSGFGVSPLLGGIFGVTSLIGLPPEPFLYSTYTYYSPYTSYSYNYPFDFDDNWFWQPYPFDYWDWRPPYFGVTSAYFRIYTDPPWWAFPLTFF